MPTMTEPTETNTEAKPNIIPNTISADQYRALQPPPLTVLPTPEQLFDFVVETLVGKKLAEYAHADPFRKKLPQGLFLLVPPQPKTLDLSYLMSLIEVDEVTGVNHLDAQHLKDEIEIPAGPYLMADIEDGKARLNTKPSVSRENIKAEGRSPYTTWRGIIHAVVFPAVFKDHNMDLCGSRYESGIVPYLCVDVETPKLYAIWLDDALPEWGAPSCGSVIVP